MGKRKTGTVFPNVEVILRIYLVLIVSNRSGERSFSKMKIIKNGLQTSMTQSDLLRSLDF